MSELIKDIKTYLVNQGIALTSVIFLDSLPDTPDNLIVISEYGGSTSIGLDEARIQILVRNTSYSTGKTLINSIRALLDTVSVEQFVTLATSRKAVFSAIQRPFKLNEDSKKRITFVCNFKVITVRD